MASGYARTRCLLALRSAPRPMRQATEPSSRPGVHAGAVVTIRRGSPADVLALQDIAAQAYGHYVARIGRALAPMTADYAEAVHAGQAWVAVEDGQIAGFVILIERPGYLLLENVAVRPAAQGRGIGGRLLALGRL